MERWWFTIRDADPLTVPPCLKPMATRSVLSGQIFARLEIPSSQASFLCAMVGSLLLPNPSSMRVVCSP